MDARLTRGAVSALSKDEEAAAGAQLVLQVVDVRPLLSTLERYRMALSDGAHLIQGILLTSMNHLVKDGRLRNGAVARLLKFVCKTIESLRVIVVFQLDVLQTNCALIGSPKPYGFGHLEKSNEFENNLEELNAESVSSSAELNSGAYSTGQGLKGHLTQGTVAALQQPVMQVVGMSLMRSGPKKSEMYHLVLSDGAHTQDAMLASHLSHLVRDSHLCKGTMVRLLEFMCNTIQSPSMMIVIQLEVLQTECALIGNPKPYELRCMEKPCGLEKNCEESYAESVANSVQPNNGAYSSGQRLKGLLTQGAVAAISEGEEAVEQQPVMQVVDVLLVCKFNRYQMVLSDGVHKQHAILASHLGHLVMKDTGLSRGTIIRLLEFTCTPVRSCRFIMIIQLEILRPQCKLIGSPKFYVLGKKHEELGSDRAVLRNG